MFGLNGAAFLSYGNVLSDRVLSAYVLRSLVYGVPGVGPRQFLPHVRKVVPSVGLEDIERAKGYGGVRPQIVDTGNKSLDMGEAKIVGDDIIFNITPSPGASTCLKNAMRDTEALLGFLDGDYELDESAFRADAIDNFPRLDGVDNPVGTDPAGSARAADD